MKKKNLKSLPLGISDFKKIIKDNNLYVDKTKYIYSLLQNDYYFLSRPRRFGKSLLISTLYYLFNGEKELFKNLWIDKNTDFPFKKHPVIRFDFSSIENRSTLELEKSLKIKIKDQYNDFTNNDIDIDYYPLKDCFKKLIIDSYEKFNERVVILIDEYDKPILDNLIICNGEDRLQIAKQNRDRLRDFYVVLKDGDVQAVTEFVFITGITKFSKMNIFSALNNLNDITMNERYSTMLGITEEEIDIYFKEYIKRLAEREEMDYIEAREKLKEYYNGYRFSEKKEKVYNPYSLLSCFENNKYKNYWVATGVPYYLANMLKEEEFYIPDLEEYELTEDDLSSFELDNIDPIVVLYQSGFLTIKEYKKIKEKFVLSFPNKEVKRTFNSLFLEKVYNYKKANDYALDIFEAFYNGEVEKGLEIFKMIFLSIPYVLLKDISNYEAFYHNLFYMMVSVAGLYANSEVLTSKERIDCVITTKDFIYIIEFKCNQSAEIALKQIKERGYVDRFYSSKDKNNQNNERMKNDEIKNKISKNQKLKGRKIYLIGINFDTEKKEIEYKYELVK